MPTYQNQTKKRITWDHKGYLEFEPDQIRALEYFIPMEVTGLTMIDEQPYVLRGKRDVGYAEMIINPGAHVDTRTYKIPYFESFDLTVFVIGTESAAVRMFIGDSEIPIAVDMKNYHWNRYAWDMSSYIIFESSIPSLVTIRVDPFTQKGMEGGK